MTRFFAFNFLQRLRKDYLHFLAFFWLFGYFLGILLFLHTDQIPFPEMHSLLKAPVSIVGSVLASVFPFLISAFAVSFAKPKALLFIAFLRAFVFSCVSMHIFGSFGSAGWLIQLLLLLSECFTIPLIYLFWMRSLSSGCNISGSWVFFCISVTVLFTAFEHCIISPFLASLIEI